MSCPWDVELGPYERLDDLQYRGRWLIQNTREFCFSLDAVLLARFAHLRPRDRLLELGTGTGVIPLLVADKVARVEAVELNPVTAALAARNAELNGLAGKITVRQCDYRELEQLCPPESYDIVLSNPPYRPIGQGEQSRLSGKARARHEVTATLADTCRAARHALRFGGRLAMVHLPERLGEIVIALHECQMEVKRLQFVQPRPGKAPNLLLLEAAVGAAPGIKVLPPLSVREEGGNYTEAIKEIYGLT